MGLNIPVLSATKYLENSRFAGQVNSKIVLEINCILIYNFGKLWLDNSYFRLLLSLWAAIKWKILKEYALDFMKEIVVILNCL